MKKMIVWIVLLCILGAGGIGAYWYISNLEKEELQVSKSEVDNAYKLLYDSLVSKRAPYFDYLDTTAIDYSLEDSQGVIVSETERYTGVDGAVARVTNQNTGKFEVNVQKAGYYHLQFDYLVEGSVLSNLIIDLSVNGETPFDEAKTIDVPLRWKDAAKEFSVDSYGDESLPEQIRIEEWSQLDLYNNTYYTDIPLLFKLEAGVNEIEIHNISGGNLLLANLEAVAPIEVNDYATYVASHTGNAVDSFVEIPAIDYIEKNSSFIRMIAMNSSVLTRHDPVYKKINVIDEDSWYSPGQEIVYEFEVEADGFYELALHYMNSMDDYSVFRTIKIDGEVPFKELYSYEFPMTDTNKWANLVVGDQSGEPYKFYLTKGTHTIALRAEYAPNAEHAKTIQLIIDHINQFALDIKKITGTNVDRDRTWRLTRYINETPAYLNAYEVLIRHLVVEMAQYAPNGQESASLSYLTKAIVKLEKMMIDPDELPLYVEDLYSGSGSVTQMLGDTLRGIEMQPMMLGRIYVYNNHELHKPNESIWASILNNTKIFLSTFTSDKYVVTNDPDAINIWVNRPITHIDTMQKMVDAEFTPQTGIKVKISLMPDANKLILANAAGEAPDIGLGLLSYMPYDLAIRGAAYDLTSFDDFWEIASEFSPGTFPPYILNDKVYAVPETLQFYALIYRKDVFRSLDLDVPDTWKDVINLLPSLQRYGMNFYYPTSGGESLKWFYQTSPLVYQYGGVLYEENGLRTTINTKEAVDGLSLLTDLYTTYSLPAQVPSFYNSFRYSTLPVGITDFTTYLQLKFAAPELVGQWGLAPYPGIEQEDGSVDRWYITNGTGGVIFNQTEKPNESWEFMKWWLSKSTQTKYGFALQSIYGPEYLWLSANIDALKELPIEVEDREVILASIDWIRDVPRTPGQYMLERGLSDIWNKSVLSNIPIRVAIDQQTIIINREIRKKMIEFGYIDEEGNELKPYRIRDVDWVQEQIEGVAR